jgi:hypothetical protein
MPTARAGAKWELGQGQSSRLVSLSRKPSIDQPAPARDALVLYQEKAKFWLAFLILFLFSALLALWTKLPPQMPGDIFGVVVGGGMFASLVVMTQVFWRPSRSTATEDTLVDLVQTVRAIVEQQTMLLADLHAVVRLREEENELEHGSNATQPGAPGE